MQIMLTKRDNGCKENRPKSNEVVDDKVSYRLNTYNRSECSILKLFVSLILCYLREKSTMKKLIVGLLTLVALVSGAQAQGLRGLFGPRQRPVPHFDGTQWYVGVTTGMNYNRPTVLERYSEFSLIGAEATTTDKDYRGARLRAGYSAGISSVLAFTPVYPGKFIGAVQQREVCLPTNLPLGRPRKRSQPIGGRG